MPETNQKYKPDIIQSKNPRISQTKRDYAIKTESIFLIAAVILSIVFIIISASGFPFLQDDAYISFRFINNLLSGHGLVFNPGEYVEGYTNFLWILLLSLFSKLGFGLESSARWLGIVFSAGAVFMTVLTARHVFSEFSKNWIIIGSIAAGLWTAVNPAISYWSVAGLETGMFLFLLCFSIERLLSGSKWAWVILALATMARPEGMLVFSVCYAWTLYKAPLDIKRTWRLPLLMYFTPLIPFALFKIIYYGSLLPNPFYAKTGFSPEYWKSGLEYLWLYSKHFALGGLLTILLFAGLIRSGLKSKLGLIAVLWVAYTIYIISIGGDVLRAHRFFVPVFPFFAAAAVGGIIHIFRLIRLSTGIITIVAILLFSIAGYHYIYANDYFEYSRQVEFLFVEEMKNLAKGLKNADPNSFSLAVPTIGRIGFDLADCVIIDMVGLTDPVISRHPESIPGMETTWKERHFNAAYLLSRNPDYILFSTGLKPSAPAERALFLHSKFRRNYYAVVVLDPVMNKLVPIYKKKGDFNIPDSLWPDLDFANGINRGLNLYTDGKYQKSINILQKTKREGPGDLDLLDLFSARSAVKLGKFEQALAFTDSSLKINPYCVTALLVKNEIYANLGNTAGMKSVQDSIITLAPYLSRLWKP